MNHGKQLRLFLPDGTPSGPRYYELVNWTGQAVVMPVSRIKELVTGSWPEFERPGVYLVRGESEEGHALLYIGESENVAKRVQGHPASLGFEVTELLLFSSKDDNMTKSHVLWLESALIDLATTAKRISLSNGTAPLTKALSKAEQARADNSKRYFSKSLIFKVLNWSVEFIPRAKHLNLQNKFRAPVRRSASVI